MADACVTQAYNYIIHDSYRPGNIIPTTYIDPAPTFHSFKPYFCEETLTIDSPFVTRFWKTDYFVIFGVIYISVNLRHSIWHHWFNKSITDKLNYYLSMGNILDVCACRNYISIDMDILFISRMTIWSIFQNSVTFLHHFRNQY